MNDLIIIGGGPAGLTAALYALRSGNKVTLIEQGAPGGQLLKTEQIDNYPGFPKGIPGMELATNMFQQINNYSNLTLETQSVTAIKPEKDHIKVEAGRGNWLESKAIILAMGGNPRLLDVPGELDFIGKGVSYCAICDGFFFKDKVTTVVGGGDTAVEDALYLARIASDVHLVHRRDSFRASPILTEQLKNHKNLHLHLNYTPKTVLGNMKVESLIIENTKDKTEEIITTDGIFVAIGQKMNTDFLGEHVNLNQDGRIIVDHKMATNTPGIFACGDIVAKSLYQVSTAVGDGAIAGQEAVYFIENKR